MDKEKIKQAIDSGIAPFAVTTYRNQEKVFGIKVDDRRRHVYLVGKTGMGKTTLIENMVYSDILAGHGVCYVDPHGDTAEKMLEWIPTERINDVIYFNPADLKYPISFNVLEKVSPEYRHLVSSGLIGVFKKLWADSWGPRLEYILRHSIMALLEYPDSTLLGINRMLVDKEYNKKVVAKITDPVVKSFWTDEYPKWNERVLQEVISPIQNKVGQFLSTALIRNVVGQVKSSINLRKIMDDRKILILNLSKGRIGEDSSALLGAMIITKIQLAAMSRVDVLEEDRNDFYLYVDEFQNFATEAFADILSEARKYHLNLIIAHQYIEQLGEIVQPAVFGNVGTIICFRIGAADAEFLEREFMPHLTQQDLVNLPKFHIYLKLMINGVASEPFSAKGLPPVYGDSLGNEKKVINVSRERYAKKREIVEDKISRWSERGESGGMTLDESNKKSDKPGFPAKCSSCNKEIEVPFQPDGVRPVFCKDCLKDGRKAVTIHPPEPVKKADEPKDQSPAISLSQIDKQTVDFKGKPKNTERKKESRPQQQTYQKTQQHRTQQKKPQKQVQQPPVQQPQQQIVQKTQQEHRIQLERPQKQVQQPPVQRPQSESTHSNQQQPVQRSQQQTAQKTQQHRIQPERPQKQALQQSRPVQPSQRNFSTPVVKPEQRISHKQDRPQQRPKSNTVKPVKLSKPVQQPKSVPPPSSVRYESVDLLADDDVSPPPIKKKESPNGGNSVKPGSVIKL